MNQTTNSRLDVPRGGYESDRGRFAETFVVQFFFKGMTDDGWEEYRCSSREEAEDLVRDLSENGDTRTEGFEDGTVETYPVFCGSFTIFAPGDRIC